MDWWSILKIVTDSEHYKFIYESYLTDSRGTVSSIIYWALVCHDWATIWQKKWQKIKIIFKNDIVFYYGVLAFKMLRTCTQTVSLL